MSLLPFQRQRGVSLVEALVAMAVMAIGMVGLVGLQGTLRSNSDFAKQRSEAVRIAQERIEDARAFVSLDGATPNFNGVVSTTFAAVTGSNAVYTPTLTVTPLPAPRQGKSIKVQVNWTNRANEAQSVTLATVIAGISPELPTTLAVPGEGDLVRQPQGRNRAIPVQAKVLPGDNRYSGLKPPGGGSVAWRFDNVTGLITLCTTSAATTNDLDTGNLTCSSNIAMLLSGFTRYSTAGAPSASDPTSIAPAVPPTPQATYSSAAGSGTINCPSALGGGNTYTIYYCAVPVQVVTPGVAPIWSGSLSFAGNFFAPMAPAPAASAVSPGLLKACRYHANASYSNVNVPLANQNYLFMQAGDGTNPYTCPSPTVAHQPL